jgi:hypothetical protein
MHGIIRVGNFAGPGTYLRARVQQYDLDKVIHKGRIWRLVYDGVKADKSDVLRRDRIVPRMNNETPAQLVTHLSHPNGWWRDTAQQLLVLKQDKSVVPALRAIVKTSPNLLARFHALWTIEGLVRSSQRSCASSWKIRSRVCGSGNRPARRFTKPVTGRLLPTTRRWRRIPT